MHRYISLVPSPKFPCQEESVTLEEFLGCTGTWLELHSDWLTLNQDCTMLLCDQIQYHMKFVALQDWPTHKQECWACKNQESNELSPVPFPPSRVGARDDTIDVLVWGRRIYGALVQFGCYQHNVNGRVCGTLVQFSCYQHRHKWMYTTGIGVLCLVI